MERSALANTIAIQRKIFWYDLFSCQRVFFFQVTFPLVRHFTIGPNDEGENFFRNHTIREYSSPIEYKSYSVWSPTFCFRKAAFPALTSLDIHSWGRVGRPILPLFGPHPGIKDLRIDNWNPNDMSGFSNIAKLELCRISLEILPWTNEKYSIKKLVTPWKLSSFWEGGPRFLKTITRERFPDLNRLEIPEISSINCWRSRSSYDMIEKQLVRLKSVDSSVPSPQALF